MQNAERHECTKVVEREIIVNNIMICVKSVFVKQTTLENAVNNIITRKISDSKTNLSA